jgi:hypothetical protein
MEIIILPKDLSEMLLNENLEDIKSDELEFIKKEFNEIDDSYNISLVNFGKGADWVLLLIGVASLTNIIILGDKIEKGIAGWIKIGNRIKTLFKKADNIYLDVDAAKFLVLDYLYSKYRFTSIVLILENIISLENVSSWFGDRKETDFISTPHNLYILGFVINDTEKVVLSVRSDGKIIELVDYEIDSNQWPY